MLYSGVTAFGKVQKVAQCLGQMVLIQVTVAMEGEGNYPMLMSMARWETQCLIPWGSFTDTLPAGDFIFSSIYSTRNSCNSNSFCNVLMFLAKV